MPPPAVTVVVVPVGSVYVPTWWLATATSFVPSADDATDDKYPWGPVCVQLAPESADV